MSDDKLQDAIYRGGRAEELLKDDLLRECFERMEADYTAALIQTRPTESEAREKLYLAINVARKVRDHLGTIAASGKLAKREIDELIAWQLRPRA